METITIKTPEDVLPYVGRRARLYWDNRGNLEHRGEGMVEAPGAHSVSVAPIQPADIAGRVWLDPCTAKIELLDVRIRIQSAADARKWEGRRVELFFDGKPRGVGILTVQSWRDGGFNLLIDGQCCPGLIGVVGPCFDDLTLTPLDTLADRLETARAEVARLEAEIAREADEAAEQKAREEREAEDARYPLPQGYRWIEADCVEDSDGFSIEIDHAETDRHISGTLDPDGTPILSIEDPDDHGVMISARLDVVRALIARYDAQHGAKDAKPEPYTIDIRGKWASDVSHTFQDCDVIDLTFCSGRVERATIDRVDSDGDIWIRGGYLGDHGDHSRIAGYVDGRGVIKITLVSRGAQ